MKRHRLLSCVALALAGAAVITLITGEARAEIIRGTLTYTDGDLTPATPPMTGMPTTTPIRRAKVEILRNGAITFTTSTDENGFFSLPVPFAGVGTTYSLRVFATNPGAVVNEVGLHFTPFYRQPGLPNPEMIRTSVGPSTPLEFNFNFDDDWARRHFNIADALLHAFDYARLRRDNRETDVLDPVHVMMNDPGLTYYDPVFKSIRLDFVRSMDDFVIIHEYAHYLQEAISGFQGVPSIHDGCTAVSFGIDILSPELAWMEGFASYFELAVRRAAGTDANGSRLDGPFDPGFIFIHSIETPSCPGSTVNPMGLEVFVAAALNDIMDAPSPGEPFDELCAERAGIANDRFIMEILDRELDIGFANPNLQMFVNAWINRGLDMPPLLATLGTSGLAPTVPGPTIRYDNNPAANLAIWRPGANAEWWVAGSPITPQIWGITGDKPVPGNYDGDNLTDLAIFRNGEWWIRLSASSRDAVEVWGGFGDIPLPGDYDNDGETDLAVYRPDDGKVFIHDDTCGLPRTVNTGFGTPVVGDFNGDGFDEPAVFTASTGRFVITFESGDQVTRNLGGTAGVPIVLDVDHDGNDDPAIYRPATGMWDISTGWHPLFGDLITSRWWGEPGDIPVPADYDGDGRDDLATWNANHWTWWIAEADGPQWSAVWGFTGDIPVPAP
jgi:hypothetical protein